MGWVELVVVVCVVVGVVDGVVRRSGHYQHCLAGLCRQVRAGSLQGGSREGKRGGKGEWEVNLGG